VRLCSVFIVLSAFVLYSIIIRNPSPPPGGGASMFCTSHAKFRSVVAMHEVGNETPHKKKKTQIKKQKKRPKKRPKRKKGEWLMCLFSV